MGNKRSLDYPIMYFFTYDHLPERLQKLSKPFCDLAHEMSALLTEDPSELDAGLRKLLEAKDCFVRAALRDE